jgi:hypothetical protein
MMVKVHLRFPRRWLWCVLASEMWLHVVWEKLQTFRRNILPPSSVLMNKQSSYPLRSKHQAALCLAKQWVLKPRSVLMETETKSNVTGLHLSEERISWFQQVKRLQSRHRNGLCLPSHVHFSRLMGMFCCKACVNGDKSYAVLVRSNYNTCTLGPYMEPGRLGMCSHQVTGWTTGKLGFDSQRRQSLLSSPQCSELLGVRPASCQVSSGGSFPGG